MGRLGTGDANRAERERGRESQGIRMTGASAMAYGASGAGNGRQPMLLLPRHLTSMAATQRSQQAAEATLAPWRDNDE